MEGRVYQLPDVTIPIARVQADSVNDTTKWTNGPVGILAFNYTDGVGTPAGGPADVTFDNFYCAPTPPQAITDDFSDSNDTLPAPAWVHVDPLADALAGAPGCYAGAGFTFPSQNYNMASPVPWRFDAGGPRVYSIAGDAIFTDFYLSVDAINWDSSAHILFGLLARAANVGLGTTDGYLLTWENGNGGPTDGDFDLLRITGEGGGSADQMEHVIPGQNSGMHLNDGTGYRFTFAGSGTNFVARIYQLPDTYNPVKTIFAQDNTPGGSLIPSGKVGLVVFDHPAQGDHAVNATFDNFFAEVAEPRLSLDTSSGSAVVSWPGNLANIWALESGTNVSTGSVWIEVPAINIGYSAGLNMHTNTAPMTETENTYYRLRRISPTQYP